MSAAISGPVGPAHLPASVTGRLGLGGAVVLPGLAALPEVGIVSLAGLTVDAASSLDVLVDGGGSLCHEASVTHHHPSRQAFQPLPPHAS